MLHKISVWFGAVVLFLIFISIVGYFLQIQNENRMNKARKIANQQYIVILPYSSIPEEARKENGDIQGLERK